MRILRRLSLGLSMAALALACTSEQAERPGPLSSAADANLGGNTALPRSSVRECEQPAEIDTSRTCGEETVELFQQKPTIYFVLDVSGSMANAVLDGSEAKLTAAKSALVDVATEIGHRVSYGLSVFPGEDDEFELDSADLNNPPLFGCAAGDEVFAIQEGDPILCLNRPPNGPVLRDFRRKVYDLKARGGTPLSPTLEALIPSLAGQEGKTALVLLTDGSPNCNSKARCQTKDCEANREGLYLGLSEKELVLCDDDFNCCDPDLVGEFIDSPQSGCVDIDASEKALQILHDAGVDTYVIGVVGERNFDDDMNRLAQAGGKARQGELSYFDVESLDELADTVRVIGSELSQSCTIELVARPPLANELNVYFDDEIVIADEKNGWTLEETTVSLHGESCETLAKGHVTEVRLISGCRTIIR